MVPKICFLDFSDEARFWEKVDRRSEDDCWPWTAGTGSHGYGQHYLPGGVQILAHRLALQITRGQPPREGMHALHSCDNKVCVNPAHLHWGTHADNMKEAAERGLSKAGSGLGDACPQGHKYTPENILTSTKKGRHGKRYTVHSCRECNRIYLARRRANRLSEKASA